MALTPVRTGLEVLLRDRRELLRGRSVALLSNPTSVNAELQHAADLLCAAGVELRCLFGPEHGVRGEAQDMIAVDAARDPRLGVPVHSLYGTTAESLRPRPETLRGLETLIIDLQDIGSRYYTFVWTMALVAEACAVAGVEVIVLDRPNPIGGEIIEGPPIDPGGESFVGLHSVPVRHGMTPGEIARLFVAERKLDVALEVVPLEGWRRALYFDEITAPWVMPSPNMPTLDTALVYPGCCLIEGTNLSEGRGTTRPFEIFGAPWVDGWALARALDAEDLPGVRFRPLCFRPSFHKYRDTVCGGVQIHVVDRRRFRPLRTGVAIVLCARRLWPEQMRWRDDAYEFVAERPAIDLLAGGDWLRRGVERGASLDELTATWPEEERAFAERRRPFLLYS
jgi:uncharacterized protein YbbC (DUF1343 family)